MKIPKDVLTEDQQAYIDSLYTDMSMLVDETWTPDYETSMCSLGIVMKLAESFGYQPKDTRIEDAGDQQ